MDQLLGGITKPFLDAGIIGAACVALCAYILLQQRTHKAEMREEREAHEKTRKAHIEAIEKGFGVADDVKDALQAMQETSQQWIELAKAAINSRGSKE